MYSEKSKLYLDLRKKGNNYISTTFLIVILLLLTTPYTDYDGSSFVKIINIGLYVLSFIYLIYKKEQLFTLLKSNMHILFLIALVPINILISINKSITMHYSIQIIGLILISFVLASNRSLRSWIEIIVIYFSILGIINLLVLILVPSVGIHNDLEHYGAWQGIMGHKNALGTVSTLGILSVILYVRIFRKRYLFSGSMIFLMSILLINSSSITALFVLIILLLTLTILDLIFTFQKQNSFLGLSIMIFLVIITSIFVGIIMVNLESILNTLGRDITLTGRTYIFDFSFEMIRDNVIWGYGYEAFWNSDLRQIIFKTIGFEIFSSHSGILDIWLDFGLVGLIIMVFLFSIGLITSLKLLMYSKNILYYFPILFFIFILVNNVTDSRFLHSRSIFFVLFLVTLFIVRKEFSEERSNSSV